MLDELFKPGAAAEGSSRREPAVFERMLGALTTSLKQHPFCILPPRPHLNTKIQIYIEFYQTSIRCGRFGLGICPDLVLQALGENATSRRFFSSVITTFLTMFNMFAMIFEAFSRASCVYRSCVSKLHPDGAISIMSCIT